MSRSPLNLFVRRTSVVTPNPIALVMTPIIASPAGNGQRLRIRGWRVYGHRANGAGATLDAIWWQVAAGAGDLDFDAFHMPLLGAGAARGDYEGGFALAPNTALSLQHVATAVAQQLRVTVAYTVEGV